MEKFKDIIYNVAFSFIFGVLIFLLFIGIRTVIYDKHTTKTLKVPDMIEISIKKHKDGTIKYDTTYVYIFRGL